jgi:hypothetical protein
MCGGAAHVILAANCLTQQKIPYKIIIDRFFTRYVNIFDYKTLNLQNYFKKKYIFAEYSSFILRTFHYGIANSLFVASLFLSLIKKMIISNVDIDFSKKVVSIPPEDILILQGKSKKSTSSNVIPPMDLFIHPKNDIRQAIKERRKKNKNVLKNLMGYCDFIMNISWDKMTNKIFLDLKKEFNKALELIDNEKLKYTVTHRHDLHQLHLPFLETRHGLPIKQFIPGFFKKPLIDCSDLIRKIASSVYIKMLDAIKHLPCENYSVNKQQLSNALIFFLRELKENEKFIIYILNRVSSSEMGNPSISLKNLLDSSLWKTIHKKGDNKIKNQKRTLLRKQ